MLGSGHDEGNCTLFYCCFGHYRMLAYKISACEVCIIWQKPTEALKFHCQLPGRGLGSQQWSHYRYNSTVPRSMTRPCGRTYLRAAIKDVEQTPFPSVFSQVLLIFQRRKGDTNKQDFEIQLNLSCQFHQPSKQ